MTYICLNCGKAGFTNRANQKFCCPSCREDYREAKRRSTAFDKCRFNDGVACEGGDCDHCGWNPKVGNKRKERL